MALSPSTVLQGAQRMEGRVSGVGGAGESTGRHFLWGQEGSREGVRSSGGQAGTSLHLPSTKRPVLGGSVFSVLGGAPTQAAAGSLHTFAGL